MIPNNYKTSLRIPSQLPEFVRDDLNYETFVAFVQAYYEWMELANTANANTSIATTSGQGQTYGVKNLTNYFDVDSTLDGFLQYYINEFLPYFPEDALSDKAKVLKIAKQLYQTKGTAASYKLLFRLLYNSEPELLLTKDLVFRASDGEWFIPKLLKIKSDTTDWLNLKLQGYRVFGEISKSFATIEIVQLNNDKYDVYLSNIQRLFSSGETVRIVNSTNEDVYILNDEIVSSSTPGASIITGKLVGAVSAINIDPINRGETYNIGDPVVVYGGLNDENGIGATAEVGSVTSGIIQGISVLNGGHGYRFPPLSDIIFTGPGVTGAEATIIELDTTQTLNITVPTTVISEANNAYSSINSISTTALKDYLAFDTYETSPIATVALASGGGGYTQRPTVSAESLYYDDTNELKPLLNLGILSPLMINTSGEGYSVNTKIIINGGRGFGASANVTNIGANGEILQVEYVPYEDTTEVYPLGGLGYTISDLETEVSTNFAPVVVEASSSIQTFNRTGNFKLFEYVYQPPNATFVTDDSGLLLSSNATFIAKITGMSPSNNVTQIYQIIPNSVTNPNYTDIYGNSFNTPDITTLKANTLLRGANSAATINVSSAIISGSNSSIVAPGILGADAIFSTRTGRIGSVLTINVTNPGEDYVATPNVSLRVQDLAVTGITNITKFKKGILLFQGEDIDLPNDLMDINTAPYQAYFDSITLIIESNSVENSIYNIRVYNYIGSPVLYDAGNSANTLIQIDDDIGGQPYDTMKLTNVVDSTLNYVNGVKTYGDGNAKASTRFLNGLIYGNGRYINNKGQPSSYSVLQNFLYNDFTYIVSVAKPISKYRDILRNLLHPSGTNVQGRDLLDNQKVFDFGFQSGFKKIAPLQYWANWPVGNPEANATMKLVGNNISSNVITINNMNGGKVSDILSANDYITIYPDYGYPITSQPKSFDDVNSTITLKDSIILAYNNVALCYSDSDNNRIQISDRSITNTPNFDIINSGNYSNTKNHMEDFVFPGDTVIINGDSYVIQSVDYESHTFKILNTSGILATEANVPIITQDSLYNILLGEYIISAGSPTNPVPFSINRRIATSNVYIQKIS